MYTFFSFFNLDTSYVVHEECLSSPFLLAWLTLGAVLLVVGVQVGTFAATAFMHRVLKMEKTPGRKRVLLQKYMFVTMSAVYPLTTKRCLSLLHCPACDTAESCELGRTMLLRGPTMVKYKSETAAGIWQGNGTNVTKVEAKLPCWQGEHAAIGALAVVVLCVFVVGYPVISYWRMLKVVKHFDKSQTRLNRCIPPSPFLLQCGLVAGGE